MQCISPLYQVAHSSVRWLCAWLDGSMFIMLAENENTDALTEGHNMMIVIVI